MRWKPAERASAAWRGLFDARPGETSRANALRRAKISATIVLLACVATLVASRLAAPSLPAMAYVAAFAEAAVIGGLADWYAVVAIFRRPLGLPLPHTAIVVRERDRIADRLGTFLEENFLSPEILDRRLQDFDFVEAARRWLRDPSNAEQVASRIVAASPFVIEAIEKSGLRDDVLAEMKRQLSNLDMGRIVSLLLRSSFVKANRHRLPDAALAGVLKMLSSPRTLGELREAMRREMPALLKVAGGDHAVFRKLVLSIADYIESVRSDPDHSLHRDFDAMMDALVDDIDRSPEAARAIARLRDAFFASDEFERLGRLAFEALRDLLSERSESVAQSLSAGLVEAMPRVASLLDATDEQSARFNREIRTALAGAIGSRRAEIGDFVAAQVRSWKSDEMVALVEENIGRDLQFIRINGAVVGGLAGLAIFALSRALGAH